MNIQKSEVRLRQRGHNLGLPMLHFSLSTASGPPVRQLVVDIVKVVLDRNSKSKWICLETGDDGIPTGIGSLINGLSACGLDVDLHIHKPYIHGNSSSSPSWINKPKTVVVDYADSTNLNYFSLTKNDVLSFEQPEPSDNLIEVFIKYNLVPATKWIYTDEEEYLSLVEENDRSRLSWVS